MYEHYPVQKQLIKKRQVGYCSKIMIVKNYCISCRQTLYSLECYSKTLRQQYKHLSMPELSLHCTFVIES